MAVINEGSLFMQARWDWSNHTVAGKWGSSQQVYRHTRPFVPDSSQEAGPLQDGVPVVVTRNKVRGRGRALSIKFTCEPGKDAHLLGWSTNFIVLSEV